MPFFKVFPIDPSFSSAEIVAESAAAIFHIVGRLDCREADVLVDDVYSFSVRLGDNGLWTIFQRDRDEEREAVQAFC